MLFRTVVTKWEGIGVDTRVVNSTTGDTFVFNANRVNGILVRSSTKSSFMFTSRLGDPREKASYVESTDLVATLKTRADLTWQSAFVALPIFPDNDDSQVAVSTLINCDSIVYAYKDAEVPNDQSYVVYQEGGKLRTVRVHYSLRGVLSMANDGNTTTSAE